LSSFGFAPEFSTLEGPAQESRPKIAQHVFVSPARSLTDIAVPLGDTDKIGSSIDYSEKSNPRLGEFVPGGRFAKIMPIKADTPTPPRRRRITQGCD
jgi:hypothetical protein